MRFLPDADSMKLHFNRIGFAKGANFYQSLLNEASFSEIRFGQESNFNFVVFGQIGRIIFDVVDLRKHPFLIPI